MSGLPALRRPTRDAHAQAMTAQVHAESVVPCSADRAVLRLAKVVGAPRLGSPRQQRRTTISSWWWTPTGRFAHCFPELHAELAVTAIDDTSSLLSVVGGYVPPFGAVGSLADRAGLHRIATATVTEFTNRVARALAEPEEGSP
jgi:hypothetical protein